MTVSGALVSKYLLACLTDPVQVRDRFSVSSRRSGYPSSCSMPYGMPGTARFLMAISSPRTSSLPHGTGSTSPTLHRTSPPIFPSMTHRIFPSTSICLGVAHVIWHLNGSIRKKVTPKSARKSPGSTRRKGSVTEGLLSPWIVLVPAASSPNCSWKEPHCLLSVNSSSTGKESIRSTLI